MVTLRPRVPKKQEQQDIPDQKKKQVSHLPKQKQEFPIQRNEKVFKKRSWSSTNGFGHPVGLRFNPTETELVGYYLNSRITNGEKFQTDFVAEYLRFYDTEPWVIWEKYADSESNKLDDALYFFACRKWRRKNSTRFDRKVGSGTWSGQYARDVYDDEEDDGEAIGVRREFRYETNESDCEKLHDKAWLLKEYQIDAEDEIVLCVLKRNLRQMPPTAKNKGSSSCVQRRKTKVERPRVKRCKVEESSDEKEEQQQGISVDVPKMDHNPFESAEDHSMLQVVAPYCELNGYPDFYYPELCVEDTPYSSTTTDELLALTSALCGGSNLNLVPSVTDDFTAMLFS